MITVKCIEKIRNKNGIITHYILADCNGIRQTLSSTQVKNMLKCGQLNILNLKLTSNGKLIDKQDHKKSWEENYKTLCRAINNGVKVTRRTIYEGVNIGFWVNTQCQLFKNGKLPEDKIQKLKDVGLELDIRKASWDTKYKTLCRAISNRVKITETTVYEGINIGSWINTQRQLFKNGKLSEDKAQKLKGIGLELEIDTRNIVPWEENYNTLCKALNNGVKITQRTVYEGINIGKWLSNQRTLFKNGKLSEDKAQKIKDIGLEIEPRKIVSRDETWNEARDAAWDETYETLCRGIDNKVEINQRTIYEGINIGKWIYNQRQLFKKGELPEDRTEKLRKIGVIV